MRLGNPPPGYCGTNRRVGADNLFGMTYGESKRRANESQRKIEEYQEDLLKKTSHYKPAYKWSEAH